MSQRDELVEALKSQVKVLEGEVEPLRKQCQALLSENMVLLARIGELDAELKACKILSGNRFTPATGQ